MELLGTYVTGMPRKIHKKILTRKGVNNRNKKAKKNKRMIDNPLKTGEVAHPKRRKKQYRQDNGYSRNSLMPMVRESSTPSTKMVS